ncbi:hypothetical protein DL89DRAFT_260200 [Linderina pennispora]|uniref:Ankyrin n=1 Tax=Linderina pennispora TaxID=61395 RepID=A0A1Y1VZ95_9FUNG|nr:uncharacterized protein DL89DRAFT_260200 [Linderina pennispora]ORX66573.1 hypothetical protein DL89DRAFT_260200 [Linderina pennispora]
MAVRAHYYLAEFGRHRVLDGKLGLHGRRPQLIRQDIVLLLLNLGADPRADDQWIFRFACSHGWTVIVQKVLRMCLHSIDTADGTRQVLRECPEMLFEESSGGLENWRGSAAVNIRSEHLCRRMQHLIDVHADDDEALRIACGMGFTGVVRALLQAGADVNVLDGEPLVLAATHMQTAVVKMLIANGASVMADHVKALRSAVLVGDANMECVTCLLEAGADPQAMDNSSLLTACYKGDGEFPKPPPLRDYCSDLDRPMSRAHLLKFSYAGVPSNGPLYDSPAIRNAGPLSPSMMPRQPRRYRNQAQASRYASQSGSVLSPAATAMSSVVATPTNPASGSTSYHDKLTPSSPTTHIGLVRLLLARGANADARNGRPLVYACSRGSTRIAAILLAYGAHVSKDEALCEAAECGHLETIRLLVNAQANVHVGEECPLRNAARGGHLDVVRLLIGEGADVSGQSGILALRAAARAGWVEIVRELVRAGACSSDDEFRRCAMRSRPMRRLLGMEHGMEFLY